MELHDMKIPKKSKKEMAKMSEVSYEGENDRWPYGLKLRFEEDEVKKIPSLKKFEVGDKVLIHAEGLVTSISISERQNGDNRHTVEIQLENVGAAYKGNKSPEKMSPKEYKKLRENS